MEQLNSSKIHEFIQRPSNSSTKKSSYSDYKNHTNVKYLVSIDSFTGVFNFISPGYSGNVSGRFIVENCSILDLVKPGRVLAIEVLQPERFYSQRPFCNCLLS